MQVDTHTHTAKRSYEEENNKNETKQRRTYS